MKNIIITLAIVFTLGTGLFFWQNHQFKSLNSQVLTLKTDNEALKSRSAQLADDLNSSRSQIDALKADALKKSASETESNQKNVGSTKSTPKLPSNPDASENSTKNIGDLFGLQENCQALPDMLTSCTPFQCEFTNPFDGKQHTRQVLGMVDGKCNYVESMPNGGQMTCNYNEDTRKNVAEYYRDIDEQSKNAESIGINLSFDTSGSGEGDVTVDGNPVNSNHSLEDAMKDGTCVVSGY